MMGLGNHNDHFLMITTSSCMQLLWRLYCSLIMKWTHDLDPDHSTCPRRIIDCLGSVWSVEFMNDSVQALCSALSGTERSASFAASLANWLFHGFHLWQDAGFSPSMRIPIYRAGNTARWIVCRWTTSRTGPQPGSPRCNNQTGTWLVSRKWGMYVPHVFLWWGFAHHEKNCSLSTSFHIYLCQSAASWKQKAGSSQPSQLRPGGFWLCFARLPVTWVRGLGGGPSRSQKSEKICLGSGFPGSCGKAKVIFIYIYIYTVRIYISIYIYTVYIYIYSIPESSPCWWLV